VFSREFRSGDRTWQAVRTPCLRHSIRSAAGDARFSGEFSSPSAGFFRGPARALSTPAMTGLKQAVLLVSAAEATAPLRHRFPAPRTAEIRPILREALIAFFDEPAGVIVAGSAFQ
jgi:hypothetical protein